VYDSPQIFIAYLLVTSPRLSLMSGAYVAVVMHSLETVMYGYESSATLTTDRLHYKLQTRLLVGGGAPRRKAKHFSGKGKEKVKSGHGLQRGARHQDILTDTVSRKVTSTS
jgi:hypothetical protein